MPQAKFDYFNLISYNTALSTYMYSVSRFTGGDGVEAEFGIVKCGVM